MNWQDYRDQEIRKHAEMIRHWVGDDLRHDGENRLGIEFKYDQRFRETGNFYIETAEKARPREGEYAPSGIFRLDNTWLWVQGDLQDVWVFFKSKLLALNSDSSLPRVNKATSRGYLLPLSLAHKHVLRILPHRTADKGQRQDGGQWTLEDALLNPYDAENRRASVDGEWVA